MGLVRFACGKEAVGLIIMQHPQGYVDSFEQDKKVEIEKPQPKFGSDTIFFGYYDKTEFMIINKSMSPKWDLQIGGYQNQASAEV